MDWIAPDGEALHPPIARNSKIERGFNHERTGLLLCPAGLDWNDAKLVVVAMLSLVILTLCVGSRLN